jgi:hypothetical protein
VVKRTVGILILALLALPGRALAQWPSTKANQVLESMFDQNSNFRWPPATLGPNLAPAIGAGTGWTCGAGWDCSVAGTLNKNADGVGTAAPNPALTIVAGTTYRVVTTVGAVTAASGFTYTLGGVSGLPITAAGTYIDYFTAATTASLIYTPTPTTTRFTITAVSVMALSDGTGDLTVDGTLTVNSGSTFKGPLLLPDGTDAAPSFAFSRDPDTGFRWHGSAQGYFCIINNATLGVSFGPGAMQLPTPMILSWGDAYVSREAANTVQLGIDAATASANALKGPDSTGANVTGGALTLRAGAGTAGNATGGQLILGGGANAGSGERGVVTVEDGGTKPTRNAALNANGMAIWADKGGAGAPDTFEVCAKSTADAYAWIVLAVIP